MTLRWCSCPDEPSVTTLRRWLLLTCALACHVPLTIASEDAHALDGLWVSESTFGPTLRGELIVARQGSAWRATLGKAESRCGPSPNGLRCIFPEGAGEFRGQVSGTELVSGFWIQPPGGPAREDLGQPYATPLVLQHPKKNSWRATVQPLEDRFTLYLEIFRNDQGELIGAFRNPQANSRGGTSLFRVAPQGDTVRFSARPDPEQPEISHEARLLHAPDRIEIRWPDAGRTLELTRHPDQAVPNFFPRPPGETAYTYRQPSETADGWSTARASAVGVDEAVLTRIVQRLIDADPAAQRPSLIHSMLVARRGKLILEEYFFGFDRDTPHDTRSAAKTFASVMLGATMVGPRSVPRSGPIAPTQRPATVARFCSSSRRPN